MKPQRPHPLANRSNLTCLLVPGLLNPPAAIEQLTLLMFVKRLDDLHTVEERMAEDMGVNATEHFPERHQR